MTAPTSRPHAPRPAARHGLPRLPSAGFTLVELLIVVAILGIVASVAYPAYTDSVRKGQRAQARAGLVELLQQQERYMTQRNCYLAFATDASGTATPLPPQPANACGGLTATSVPFKTYVGDAPSSARYWLSASTCSGDAGSTLSIAQCVQVSATPVQPDPLVGTLRMTSTGAKSCTGTAASTQPSLCWP